MACSVKAKHLQSAHVLSSKASCVGAALPPSDTWTEQRHHAVVPRATEVIVKPGPGACWTGPAFRLLMGGQPNLFESEVH